MKNNINLTLYTTIVITIISLFIFEFSIVGLLLGIFYAQIIEWFVHGWVQHHRFKIFKSYRDNHTYHHKHPDEPLSVQPIQYFLFGSIVLLLPFFTIGGFVFGYLIAYALINVIHNDLHSTNKMLPSFVWNSGYFKRIVTHHEAHHKGKQLGYTTHSVTNPYLDMVLSKIKLDKVNNYIARHLKI